MRALAILVDSLSGSVFTQVGSVGVGRTSEAQPRGDAKDPMAAILAALRTEEARYQNLEYLIRTTSREAGSKPGEAADEFNIRGDAARCAPGRSSLLPRR